MKEDLVIFYGNLKLQTKTLKINNVAIKNIFHYYEANNILFN